jgi:hypothetical protein
MRMYSGLYCRILLSYMQLAHALETLFGFQTAKSLH